MDSIQAIKFIKENIEHFGGDPNQITVFGQSSGAAMISALVISPNVPNDLFQRAIIQSGSIFGTWTYSSEPIEDACNFALTAGLNPTRSIGSLNQAFKKLKVSNLLQAASRSRVKRKSDRCSRQPYFQQYSLRLNGLKIWLSATSEANTLTAELRSKLHIH